jgi:protocatechuate 3,4-dioxygenase beta subunit
MLRCRVRELFVVSGALLLWASNPFLATDGARVSGWTLTRDGLALSGVEVVLACPPAPVRRTLSDDQGRFELANLPAGNCTLRGSKPGYVDANVEGDPGIQGAYGLRVLEGTSRDGFEMRLDRGVILTGRITDSRGRAARGIRVHPIRREMANGTPRLKPMPYRPVDSSGAFEFPGLPPGEYYVGASPVSEGSDAGGASGYAVSYFPGTANFAEAQTVALQPGESRRVEFALTGTRAFSVSGMAYDDAGPVSNASVGLSLETEPKWLRGNTRTAADGTFAFTGVQPGRYVLRVARQLVEIGEAHFDVDDGDVGNLVVRVGPRR